jgi:hypothetical protein
MDNLELKKEIRKIVRQELNNIIKKEYQKKESYLSNLYNVITGLIFGSNFKFTNIKFGDVSELSESESESETEL